jgi:hypothetical protein
MWKYRFADAPEIRGRQRQRKFGPPVIRGRASPERAAPGTARIDKESAPAQFMASGFP